MRYVNVGARLNGTRPRSKNILKRVLATDPQRVIFEPTSPFDEIGPLTGDSIPDGVTLIVCGPDPCTERYWYGQVYSTREGPCIS